MDSAKTFSWFMPIKDKRINFSNELVMVKPLDGNLIKVMSSGGDTKQARRNRENEIDIKIRATFFMNVNDIPKIEPFDEGRIRCVEFKKTFVKEVTDPIFQCQAIDDIKYIQ